MNKTNYITSAEFQAYAPNVNIGAYSDVTLSGIISQASEFVDSYLNYSLAKEQIVGEISEAIVSTDGDLMLFPKKLNIQSLDKLQITLGVYTTELVLNDSSAPLYTIPTPPNHILYPYQQLTLTGKVGLKNLLQVRTRTYFTKISYTAGYDIIPDNIKRATILLVRDILNIENNPTGANSMSQGGLSVSYSADEDSKLVKQAKQILDKYVRRWE